MTRRPLVLIAPLVLLSALASAVSAQTPPPGGGGMSLPRTAEQVAPWAARMFARLDANADDSLTGDELAVFATPSVAAMGGSRMRAMIVQSDGNRDSRISLDELTAGARRLFNRMDRDGDGQLSEDERPQRPARPEPFVIPPAEPVMPGFPDTPNGG